MALREGKADSSSAQWVFPWEICPARFRFPKITCLQNSDMTSLLPKLPKKSKLGKSKSERQFLFKALKILEGL